MYILLVVLVMFLECTRWSVRCQHIERMWSKRRQVNNIRELMFDLDRCAGQSSVQKTVEGDRRAAEGGVDESGVTSSSSKLNDFGVWYLDT